MQTAPTRLDLATADLAWVTGWASWDIDDHDQAQKLWAFSLNRAKRAEHHPRSTDLTIGVLLDAAYQALQRRQARTALRLVEHGVTIANTSAHEASVSTRRPPRQPRLVPRRTRQRNQVQGRPERGNRRVRANKARDRAAMGPPLHCRRNRLTPMSWRCCRIAGVDVDVLRRVLDLVVAGGWATPPDEHCQAARRRSETPVQKPSEPNPPDFPEYYGDPRFRRRLQWLRRR